MTDTIRRCRALGNEAADADDTAFLLRLGAAALGKDGRLHPAAAGILLFAGIETILSLFPEYRFYYTDPSGDTRQYGKNLLDIYLTVCDEITASCAAAADPEIRRGILEAFSNSLINADYHAAGGLCVRAAPDRIEFSNPGSFRVQKERVYAGGVSDPRNTVIFRVFKYMEIGRGTGSGIQNLFYVWKRHGFSAPEIREEFHPERITTVLPLTGDVKREPDPHRCGGTQRGVGGRHRVSDEKCFCDCLRTFRRAWVFPAGYARIPCDSADERDYNGKSERIRHFPAESIKAERCPKDENPFIPARCGINKNCEPGACRQSGSAQHHTGTHPSPRTRVPRPLPGI